jgi:nifR3 family TIM-barrel protein
LFTEFVSTDGLCSRGKENLLKHLIYDESERPIVAQIFGNKPEKFAETARLIVELGFDGIDINMGCPVRTIIKQESGSALIKTPQLARELIIATKEGAGDLPVSVKTRIGFNKIDIEQWVPALIESKPAALTFHLRTAKEMSKVDAHWEVAHEIARLGHDSGILVFGNGDVIDLNHAYELVESSGLDGIMLGRAIFGNPWLFDKSGTTVTKEMKLNAMVEHACLFDQLFAGSKNFLMMRKHLRAYAAGFDGAKELRVAFESVNTADEVAAIVAEFSSKPVLSEEN